MAHICSYEIGLWWANMSKQNVQLHISHWTFWAVYPFTFTPKEVAHVMLTFWISHPDHPQLAIHPWVCLNIEDLDFQWKIIILPFKGWYTLQFSRYTPSGIMSSPIFKLEFLVLAHGWTKPTYTWFHQLSCFLRQLWFWLDLDFIRHDPEGQKTYISMVNGIIWVWVKLRYLNNSEGQY